MAGKSNMVTVPRTYKSGPNSHKTTATYITDDEIGLLRALDIHNSGIGTENHYGPGGLLNMDGGDTLEAIYGKGKVPSRVLRLTAKARQPTRTFVAPKVKSPTRAPVSKYAGPGHRTPDKQKDLEVAAKTRAAIAQYSPRAKEIKVKEARVGKVIPSGNGTKKNGEDPNGGGTKKTNGNGGNGGNGTKKKVKTVKTTSETPDRGRLPGYIPGYTGPEMLTTPYSQSAPLDWSQYMPQLTPLQSQRGLFANQGAYYQPWATGQQTPSALLNYTPPTTVGYVPPETPETVNVPTPEVVNPEGGKTYGPGGKYNNYHDWYMAPENPMGHYAALWRTGGQYGYNQGAGQWGYQPGAGPWTGVGGREQPTSRTFSDLLNSIMGSNEATTAPAVGGILPPVANVTGGGFNYGGILDY